LYNLDSNSSICHSGKVGSSSSPVDVERSASSCNELLLQQQQQQLQQQQLQERRGNDKL
jgi:hypothetical protein